MLEEVMNQETYFEQVPLDDIRHIIEAVPLSEAALGATEEIQPTLFSVRFVWAEHNRYFYDVVMICAENKAFIVSIDGLQEASWGTPVPTNGREIVGTCQSAIEKWCRLNLDQLPASGETKQIFLDGIPR
jgi:hypothetical protein